MEVQRFTEPAAFQTEVSDFLALHEAEHCVQIGILNSLTHDLSFSDVPPYLAMVVDGAQIVMVAVMTPPYNLLISHNAPPAAIDLIAQHLADGASAVRGILAPDITSHYFATIWQQLTGQTFHPGYHERLYRLTHVNAPSGVPGQMRRAQESDRAALQTWLGDFEQEALHSMLTREAVDQRITRYLTTPVAGLYLWEVDGEAVALAGHTGPTPHGMRIGPVYTPPDQRGHGYASALVAALSQWLLDGGRQFCFLFTDLANPTSNHIYQTIGYELLGDVQEYVFNASSG